jgi:hypothetical protein
MENRNILGSDIFGTTQIRTDEYILLAQIKVDNGTSVAAAAAEISAIDDMLSMQRIGCIIQKHRFTATGKIRKNASLSDLIDNRVGMLVEELKEINTK